MTIDTQRFQRSPGFGIFSGAALLFMAAAFLIVACEAPTPADSDQGPLEATGESHEFVFEGTMTGYIGIGGDIDGEKNPVLRVNRGDEVTITMINGENMAHDIVLDGHDVASEMLMREGEETTITFTADKNDKYYCTVPGHEQAGMVGQFEVIGADDAPRAQLD